MYKYTTIIDNQLYLSDRPSAYSDLLGEYGITHIINISENPTPEDILKEIMCLQIPIPDKGYVSIQNYFDPCNSFISNSIHQGGKCLVHCEMGLSRSPTIIMNYLMTLCGRTLKQSYDLLRSKQTILPYHFIGHLLNYEKKLYDVNTLEEVDVMFDIYKYYADGKLTDEEVREMVEKKYTTNVSTQV